MGLDHLLDLLQKSPASFPHKSVYNTSTKFNKYISMILHVHASQAWCRSTYLIHIWIPSFFSDSLGAEDLAHAGTTGTSIPELVSSSGAWWSKVSDFWGYPMQNWENQAWLSVIIIIYQPILLVTWPSCLCFTQQKMSKRQVTSSLHGDSARWTKRKASSPMDDRDLYHTLIVGCWYSQWFLGPSCWLVLSIFDLGQVSG